MKSKASLSYPVTHPTASHQNSPRVLVMEILYHHVWGSLGVDLGSNGGQTGAMRGLFYMVCSVKSCRIFDCTLITCAALLQHTCGVSGTDDAYAVVSWRHHEEQSHDCCSPSGLVLGSSST